MKANEKRNRKVRKVLAMGYVYGDDDNDDYGDSGADCSNDLLCKYYRSRMETNSSTSQEGRLKLEPLSGARRLPRQASLKNGSGTVPTSYQKFPGLRIATVPEGKQAARRAGHA